MSGNALLEQVAAKLAARAPEDLHGLADLARRVLDAEENDPDRVAEGLAAIGCDAEQLDAAMARLEQRRGQKAIYEETATRQQALKLARIAVADAQERLKVLQEQLLQKHQVELRTLREAEKAAKQAVDEAEAARVSLHNGADQSIKQRRDELGQKRQTMTAKVADLKRVLEADGRYASDTEKLLSSGKVFQHGEKDELEERLRRAQHQVAADEAVLRKAEGEYTALTEAIAATDLAMYLP
jgi:hypothetical protein